MPAAAEKNPSYHLSWLKIRRSATLRATLGDIKNVRRCARHPVHDYRPDWYTQQATDESKVFLPDWRGASVATSPFAVPMLHQDSMRLLRCCGAARSYIHQLRQLLK
jgi:hypothetical protein